jgi:LysM repeat protein
MNNPNPFDSQSNAADRVHKSRVRLRLAVFAAFGVSLVVLVPLLLVQGCKHQDEVTLPPIETNAPPIAEMDTNLPAGSLDHTNLTLPPLGSVTNTLTPVDIAPAGGNTVALPPVGGSGSEYTVTKGDSFFSIGKKFGVSTKAISDANPGVDSKHLKIGQKLSVPSAAARENVVAAGAMEAVGSSPVYIVKSGDTLLKIAKQHGTSVKAVKSANSLATDKIRVGQKLKIPVKETAPVAPMAEPAPTALPAPTELPPIVLPPVATPAAH